MGALQQEEVVKVRVEGKMSAAPARTRVGKYELGRTLGKGTFAKVKFARNEETGEHVAFKILDKEKVLRHQMIAQIKREISTMKLIRHPNIIRMLEVMASKTRIYIVMELVTGGQLFDKIAKHGRLKEDEARKYFQQLINAVDYCHSRGVFHRDLKPENLLLDASGVLIVSDFGLSTLSHQVREDGLLHTACGTPNYIAPEIINNKGYDGAKADLWSCGVILFVLMAGYLAFEDTNVMSLYKKISKAEFTCPSWFSTRARKLIKRILDPNPQTGIVKRDTRFTTRLPANEVLSKIEAAAIPLGFNVQKQNYKLKLQGKNSGRKGQLAISTEVFEVAPSLSMVELRKSNGDTLEFHKFYNNISTGLKDIRWSNDLNLADEHI